MFPFYMYFMMEYREIIIFNQRERQITDYILYEGCTFIIVIIVNYCDGLKNRCGKWIENKFYQLIQLNTDVCVLCMCTT